MAFRKVECDRFTYITYVGEKQPDYEKLKTDLDRSVAVPSVKNDVVVDFSGCEKVGAREFSALLNLVKSLRELRRCVRVVVPPWAKRWTTRIGLHRQPGVMIYESRDELLKNIEGSDIPSP